MCKIIIQKSLLIIVFLLPNLVLASQNTTLFDVNFTNSYNYSAPPLSVPISTSISFTYDLSTYQDSSYPDGSATLRLYGGIVNSVSVQTNVFDLMPPPFIDWTSAQQANVYIWRDNPTNTFKFVITNSLSYWNPYDPYKWHYFKAVSVESALITVSDYDPFAEPTSFIDQLRSQETVFSASVIQDKWRRVSAGSRTFDIYEGGSLRGSAMLAPVPEPETYAMLIVGLGLLGFMLRRRKNNM